MKYGMRRQSHKRATRQAVLKHALPCCTFCHSSAVSMSLGMPHGRCRERITLVLCLAMEKLLQGGAIMTASTRPLRISDRTCLMTAGEVRLNSSPRSNSHWPESQGGGRPPPPRPHPQTGPSHSTLFGSSAGAQMRSGALAKHHISEKSFCAKAVLLQGGREALKVARQASCLLVASHTLG